MSGRSALGGTSDRPSAALDRYAPSDSILLSTYAPLPRGKFSQTMLDVLAFLGWGLLLSVLGSSVIISVFFCPRLGTKYRVTFRVAALSVMKLKGSSSSAPSMSRVKA